MKIDQDELDRVRHQRGIFASVVLERNRQDAKWGADRNLRIDTWMTILGEEYGETCKASLHSDPINLREEAIQVAATAFAIIECIDNFGLNEIPAQ